MTETEELSLNKESRFHGLPSNIEGEQSKINRSIDLSQNLSWKSLISYHWYPTNSKSGGKFGIYVELILNSSKTLGLESLVDSTRFLFSPWSIQSLFHIFLCLIRNHISFPSVQNVHCFHNLVGLESPIKDIHAFCGVIPGQRLRCMEKWEKNNCFIMIKCSPQNDRLGSCLYVSLIKKILLCFVRACSSLLYRLDRMMVIMWQRFVQNFEVSILVLQEFRLSYKTMQNQ